MAAESLTAETGGNDRIASEADITDSADVLRNFESCGYPNSGTAPAQVTTPAACTEAPSDSPPSSFLSAALSVCRLRLTLALAGVLPSALQDFTSAAASFLAAPQERSGLWLREEERHSPSKGRRHTHWLQADWKVVEANGSYGAKMSLTQQGYDLPIERQAD